MSSLHRLTICFFVALLASACTPLTPTPALYTPTSTRSLATPLGTQAIVAFPTSTLPSATEAATLLFTPAPTTTSMPVPVVLPTPPASRNSGIPIVQLVSPITNTQISVNQPFNVVVYATDDVGIARIELFDDTVLVRTENAPSQASVFSTIITWTPTQIGVHALRAVAYDTTNRASLPDEIAVAVTTDIRRPSSIIVYPIGVPQIDFGSVLQINGMATDEAGVTQLDLFVDNQITTYITATNPLGQTPFPFVFSWNALAMGQHTFFVRAHDNQDQTTDSAPLKILVVDTHTPVVSVAYERTNALVNEPITLTVTALDVSGIQRIELVSGREVVYSGTSPNPARQTSVTTQVLWMSPNPGDFKIFARAVNANGNTKESPTQIVSILSAGQATPTSAPTPTATRTRAPRATTTPRPQPPAPPSAEILAPTVRFIGSSPLRVTFYGKGNSELDHIELWGGYQGQPNPQLICMIDAKASTQKTGQCEWSAPTAGAVSLFAQTIDIYRQVGRSNIVTGYIGAPTLPTPTPTPPSLAGRWNAPVSSSSMTATFRQSGATIRGDFKMGGVDAPGRITVGALKAERLTFTVDFTPTIAPTTTVSTSTDAATPVATTAGTPSPGALTMDFDCVVDSINTLMCNYKDSRGRSGSAFFRRETIP